VPDTRPDKTLMSMFPLVRATHNNPLRRRERKFESCRGTGQTNKFEHSNNLVPVEARAPDLRQCSAVPDLAPDTRPEGRHRSGKGLLSRR